MQPIPARRGQAGGGTTVTDFAVPVWNGLLTLNPLNVVLTLVGSLCILKAYNAQAGPEHGKGRPAADSPRQAVLLPLIPGTRFLLWDLETFSQKDVFQ